MIPTGAMAPTILGKHKEVICPMCGYRYEVSASDRPNTEVASRIYHATCPMCRFTADLAPNNPQNQSYPTYDGDRILVAKFPYEFADPKRWDIIVFKYPGDATMNYIKRLVGLPGETISIHDGDLWIHEAGQPEGHFEIARKPPEKILAMLQPVYDNDLAPTITGKLHWPARWTPEPGAGEHLWTNKDFASFETDGRAKGQAWIRYRHRVPTPEQWDSLTDAGAKDGGPSLDSVKPQLISDFTAYNTGDRDQSRFDRLPQWLSARGYGIHWVGDLAMQFDLESKSASGKVVAELIKGGRPFQCRLDLSSGKAELAIGGGGVEADGCHWTATTAVAGPGRHAIIFANIDDELTLWVDGKAVALSDPARPDAPPRRDGQAQSESEKHPNQYNSALLNNHVPTAEDLSPVGIAAEGAAVKVSHIKVLRDIYYIAVFNGGKASVRTPLKDYLGREPDLAAPQTWPEAFQDSNMRTVDIRLDPRSGPSGERPVLRPWRQQRRAAADGCGWASTGSMARCSSAWRRGSTGRWTVAGCFADGLDGPPADPGPIAAPCHRPCPHRLSLPEAGGQSRGRAGSRWLWHFGLTHAYDGLQMTPRWTLISPRPWPPMRSKLGRSGPMGGPALVWSVSLRSKRGWNNG